MSPFYEYKCEICRVVKELYFQAPPPEAVDCWDCSPVFGDTANRVWSSPNIGFVDGAGGSPSRKAQGNK